MNIAAIDMGIRASLWHDLLSHIMALTVNLVKLRVSHEKRTVEGSIPRQVGAGYIREIAEEARREAHQ